MFPPTQTHGLRYKVILSDCRKRSQEMEMHCVTLSATSGYLFGRIFLFFFFFHGNPLPSISHGIPKSMSGSRRNKPAVSCSLLRLRGGGDHFPSLAPLATSPPSPSRSKQKLMWGIQLVNLSWHTSTCLRDGHAIPFTDPLITRCRRGERGRESRSCSELSEAIDYEP